MSAFAVLRSKSGAKEANEFALDSNGLGAEKGGDSEVQEITLLRPNASEKKRDRNEHSTGGKNVPSQVFSTWSPLSQGAIEICEESHMRIVLNPGLRVTVIGHCDLLVVKGSVRFYGATLVSQDGYVPLVVPVTHALPPIECVSTTSTILELWHKKNNLQGIGKVSPLFQNIWHQKGTFQRMDMLKSPLRRSFGVIFNSADAGHPLHPLQYPHSWQSRIHEITTSWVNGHTKPPRILICGGKSSGKSTFSRLLSNEIVSRRVDDHVSESRHHISSSAQTAQVAGIFWLDIDPGQPEFSPPGQISLVLVKTPILGPPFSHSCNNRPCSYDIVRAHCLGTTDASGDHNFYLEAIEDLVNAYEQRSEFLNRCPIIINCPGYDPQSRFGSRLVSELQTVMKVTHSVYLSEDGGVNASTVLGKSGVDGNPQLHYLPAFPTRSKPLDLSAAKLRAMQTSSYFHSIGQQKWDSSEICRAAAWRLKYGSDLPDILGITTIIEHPAQASLLKTIIHKWILGIYIIEDDEEVEQALSTIQRTSDGNLPYLWDTGSGEPYRPLVQTSQLIGWGYTRAIDTENETIDVVTPIPYDIRLDLLKKSKGGYPRIVLTRGATDAPDWAYMEEFLSKRTKFGVDKGIEYQEAVELDVSKLHPDFKNPAGFPSSADDLDYIEPLQSKLGLEGRVWKPTPRITEPLPKRTRTQ